MTKGRGLAHYDSLYEAKPADADDHSIKEQ